MLNAFFSAISFFVATAHGSAAFSSDTVKLEDADIFTYPQGVYTGNEVRLTTYPNGAIVNADLLERIAHVQPEEPFTVEVADGVWALVGYHWGYKAVIEGETGLIIYDTGDYIEEAQEVLEDRIRYAPAMSRCLRFQNQCRALERKKSLILLRFWGAPSRSL